MHANSRLLFERYALAHFKAGDRVLEIGPDGDPSTYRKLTGADIEWETAELADALMTGDFRQPTRDVDHTMESEYEIPVPDAAYDVVVAGQVIEHVRRIWEWLPELARVTKPGGKVILVSPISWPHHPSPYDCWRIYPDGMRALCEASGLEPVVCRFESIDHPPLRRSFAATAYPEGRKARVLRKLGWPLPTALDLITVAVRP